MEITELYYVNHNQWTNTEEQDTGTGAGAGISGTEDLLSDNDAVLMHTVTETT